ELGATIAEVNPGSSLSIGTRVVVMPYVNCGKCYACRMGKTNCCQYLKVLGVHTDGGMQEMITVEERLLLPAPKLSSEEMAIVEPLCVGAHAVRRAEIQEGEYVAVVGCGPIGLGLMKMARVDGAKVIAMDMNDDRLAYAQDAMGVEHVVNVQGDAVAQVKGITGGDLAAAVFDATGHPAALQSGHQYMAHGGRYVLVGLYKGELAFHHPSIHAKEASILCSRNATLEDFQHVMDVLESGVFPTRSFITHEVSYKDMIANFDAWVRPETGVIKAMVHF
ncbi:MAG: zinc-binding alcohol dehydrogenase family protein, partial [Bacteroidota bacterium]